MIFYLEIQFLFVYLQQKTNNNPLTPKIMKQNFSFSEASKIFALVAKVENAVSNYEKANAEEDNISNIFDAEFSKYGYTFFKAPKELQDLFEKKNNAFEARVKAQRIAYKTIKEFAELVGIGLNYCDCWEEDIKDYIDGKKYWKAPQMVYKIKSIAINAASKINTNA